MKLLVHVQYLFVCVSVVRGGEGGGGGGLDGKGHYRCRDHI